MRNAPSSSKWLVRFRRLERPGVTLVCFPFAGGGSGAFRDWHTDLPEAVEVVSVRPPGRESRVAEPAYDDLSALAEAAATALAPELRKPFAFFGHSLGAILAYETTRILLRDRGVQPVHLIVGGRMAPHVPDPDPPIHHLPREAFLGEIRGYGGTPAEVLEHDELVDLLLPTLRADFAAAETYTHEDGPPLPCPITAIGGTEDPDVTSADIEAWGRHTKAGFAWHMLPGDHFFISDDQSRGRFLEIVADELRRYLT